MATLAAAAVTACGTQPPPDPAKALDSYRSVAYAEYRAALAGARDLQTRVKTLVRSPSAEAMTQARRAWRRARAPYSRTEALRFGHWFVDEWVPRVNRWPIDPGFIDYTDDGEIEDGFTLVTTERLHVAGRTLDTRSVDRRLLLDIQALSMDPAQIPTGYHAIEFLLWGQHRDGSGPGQRPWTDYALDSSTCTSGARAAPTRHCRRRGQWLQAMTELLVWELERMAAVWADKPGTYGYRLVHGDPELGLQRALIGLVTVSSDILADRRIETPLQSRRPEQAQDQFSDNTHASLLNTALGIEQFYYGRIDGKAAPVALADLARHADANLAGQIDRALATTRHRLARLQREGDDGQGFAQLIAPENVQGSRLLADAMIALRVQSALLSRLGEALGLGPLDPSFASDNSTS